MLGNQLEKRFHGNPSGLDTAVVAHESVISFRRGEGGVPLAIASPTDSDVWPFVLIDSGLRSSTASMIRVAAPYFTGEGGDGRIARFDELAGQVATGLADGDTGCVGQAMRSAQRYLSEAGVSNGRMEEIVETCEQVGALGAKLTGAGGGGCVLALLDPATHEEQLRELKRRIGSRHVYSVRLNG